MRASRTLLVTLATAAVGLAAMRASAPVPAETVTVNAAVRFQTMRGWGGSLSFLRDLNFVSQAAVDQMIDEAVNDLGLTFLRLGFATLAEPFNDNGDANNINWDRFYDTTVIDREVTRGLGRFAAAVQANGESATFLLNKDWEFSAPPWMDDGEFAENVTATALYYRDRHHININFSSIDNEPNTFDPYSPERQRSLIKAMGPKFQANGLGTKIALNEGISAQSTWDYILAMQNDAGVWPHVGLLNWHLYGTNDPFRSQIRDFGAARGIPTAMTEFDGAQVTHLMDDLTRGGVSYWHRYHLADTSAGSVGGGANYFAAPHDGTSFLKNHTYFQFRQFMRYVRPGAVRIDATSSHSALRAFAFERSGSRVVVLVNTSGQALAATVDGIVPGRYGVSQTVGQSFTELGAQGVGTSIDVTVAGSGVLTIYPAPSNQAPVPISWAATPGFVTLPGANVALSASAQDTDRDALSFAWTVKSAPSGANVALGSSSSANATASGLTAAGTYVFAVTIRDTAGHSVARDVTVRAYQGNQPPVIAEGHRYYKQEWLVPPESAMVFGPLFIRAIDIEGDPLTTSFSVVSQPSGGRASFSGNTVSGLTVPGQYTFRFTASDPTHTVTRDFVRRVVASAADAPDNPDVPLGGGGRRRPAGAPSLGKAAARTTPPPTGSDRSQGTASVAAAATLPRAQPLAPEPVRFQEAARILELLEEARRTLVQTDPDSGWRRVEVFDQDSDGLIDLIRIELQNGAVWTWEAGGEP